MMPTTSPRPQLMRLAGPCRFGASSAAPAGSTRTGSGEVWSRHLLALGLTGMSGARALGIGRVATYIAAEPRDSRDVVAVFRAALRPNATVEAKRGTTVCAGIWSRGGAR
jgi:hypothetical protein